VAFSSKEGVIALNFASGNTALVRFTKHLIVCIQPLLELKTILKFVPLAKAGLSLVVKRAVSLSITL
jgi:hypothetical protein